MRVARMKMIGADCYYHVCNRLAGPKNEYPFTDVDKEFGFKLVERLSRLFLVETISMCMMGNHLHLICLAPAEPPDLEEVARRHNAFYGKKKPELSVENDRPKLERLADQLIDISCFMRQLNQRFTHYYNRAHNRRGHLWADRFKSTILEGGEALWNAVKYVELNPVRAGLESDPADYRFCSWGRFRGSGAHPFAANFVKHMNRCRTWASAEAHGAADVYAMFQGELARVMAAESGADSEEIHAAARKARTGKESMPLRFLRRTRHWTDGKIIGCKAFVQETACRFEERQRAMRRRLSKGGTETGALYCLTHLLQ